MIALSTEFVAEQESNELAQDLVFHETHSLVYVQLSDAVETFILLIFNACLCIVCRETSYLVARWSKTVGHTSFF